MAEETENLVLRLLREIRDKLDDHDTRFDHVSEKMTTLERRMEEVRESVGYALGLSAHANVAYETTGERLDRLQETVEDLRARVAKLEGVE